jgi:hypothetical protein
MPAPVASGWSILPGGTCTHWKAPPCHGARHFRAFADTAVEVSLGVGERIFVAICFVSVARWLAHTRFMIAASSSDRARCPTGSLCGRDSVAQQEQWQLEGSAAELYGRYRCDGRNEEAVIMDRSYALLQSRPGWCGHRRTSAKSLTAQISARCPTGSRASSRQATDQGPTAGRRDGFASGRTRLLRRAFRWRRRGRDGRGFRRWCRGGASRAR